MTKGSIPATSSLSCPACGAPITIRGITWTLTVGCPSCGSILFRKKDQVDLVKQYKELATEVSIPLGTRCTFHGVEYEIIGSLTKCDGSQEFLWEELLLMNPYHGFAWLVNSENHWSFMRSLRSVTAEPGVARITHEGRTYRRFLQDAPAVRSVIGEFYWRVRRGDGSRTFDYIAPPYMLSAEITDDEVTWSHGEYLTPDDVQKALKIPWIPSIPQGVAMNQPNPWKGLFPFTLLSGFLCFIALFFIHAQFAPKGESEVAWYSGTLEPANVSPFPNSTTPFVIPEDHTNLMLTAKANVNNSWINLDTTLVNTETGEQDDIDAEVSYYSGYDSDGSWSEGSQTQSYYFTGVKRGTYLVSFKTAYDPALTTPINYSFDVRKNVSSTGNVVIAILAVLAAPLGVGLLAAAFEGRRAVLSSEISTDDD